MTGEKGSAEVIYSWKNCQSGGKRVYCFTEFAMSQRFMYEIRQGGSTRVGQGRRVNSRELGA